MTCIWGLIGAAVFGYIIACLMQFLRRMDDEDKKREPPREQG